ncbi:hypothetical protein [Cellulomonas sp. NPDC089187]|uniref:hypothetical protein n=1 Tax=Cellulomonas sp. NPDC089187 TaxID=3154970 RepID=UPI0034183FCB
MVPVLLAASTSVFIVSLFAVPLSDSEHRWVWVAVSGGVMVACVVALILLTRRQRVVPPAEPIDVATADREGRVFLAKVLDVHTVQHTDGRALTAVRLIAQPRNRPIYQTTIGVELRSVLTLGMIVVVAQADPDKPGLTLLDPPPSHWAQVAQQEYRLTPIWTAPQWEDDRGIPRWLRSAPIAVVVLSVLLAVGGRGWVAVQELDTSGSFFGQRNPWPSATPKLDLFDPENTQRAVDELIEASGVTESTWVEVQRYTARFDLLTGPGAQTTDTWQWQGQSPTRVGPESLQSDPDELPDELFDLTTIDWSLVGALMEQVPELTGINDPDATVYISRPTVEEVTTTVQFQIIASSAYYTGTVIADQNGQVVTMWDGAPGSPAAEWDASH